MPPEQSTVTTPAYQLPPKPPSPGRQRALVVWVTAVVILVLLVAAAAAAFFYFPPFITMRSALTMPQELKSAYFLAEGPNGTIAYRLQGLSYAAEPLSGRLVSASNQLENQIVVDAQGYHYIANGTESMGTKNPKLGITFVLDGSWAVFAAPRSATSTQTIPPVPLTAFTVDATAWHLVAEHSTATSTVVQRGPIGISPIALDQSHVLYLAPGGVSVWDVNTGKTAQLAAQQNRFISIISLVSPNHAYAGYADPIKRTITVYHVTATSAEKVVTISEGKFTSYVLGNDGVYALRPSLKNTEIWKQDFTGSAFKRIAFLPVTLNVTRLLVGSL